MSLRSIKRRISLGTIAAVGLLSRSGTGQKPVILPPTRPKIALVLEGGGALGFAHIGVLEWMEQHHIPIDDVAGTSMGGLVGGLYASGSSPKEITEFVGGVNWASVFNGQLPFSSLDFRRKEDKLAFPNRLELGLKHGVSFPNGLNTGSAVGLLLDRVMLPYYNLKNFDDLPIPFRCVSTDLTSGEAHVFEDGSLAQALRSTMSIPGMFAPVMHGEQVYSDGAAVDNLPVDIARGMGADIVIAVYLDTGALDRKRFDSLVGVAGRNVDIMVSANELKNMQNANVLLRADVSKFTSGDFEKSSEIIPKGEEIAQAHAVELEKYALNDADWAVYIKERDARRRTRIPEAKFIDVYGMKGSRQKEIEQEFSKYREKPIDPAKVEHTIAELLGTGAYQSISYNFIEKDGETGLLIRPRLKSYGPPFLNIGFTLSSNDSNDIQLGLATRATFMGLAGAGSELRVTASVGQVAGVSGELYKPLVGKKSLFIAPRAYYTHQKTSYFNGSQELAQYVQNKNGFGLDLGYYFGTKAQLRIGEDYQWYGENLTVGSPLDPVFHITPFVTSAQFQYFGQDSAQLPTRGTEVVSKYIYSTQSPSGHGGYSQLNSKVSHFIPVGSHGIIFGVGSGGTSFGVTNLGLAGFALGGPLRLSAYEQGELLGSDYFLAQAGYEYRIAKLNPVVGDAVYVSGFYEIGKVWNALAGTPALPYDISGALIVKTLIGPVYGGGSVGNDGHRKWFIGIGRIF